MNLRELRASRGYQRKFVVSNIQISSKHLNDIEAGRVNLTPKIAGKLADFYEIDVNNIKKMYEEGRNETDRNFKKTKTAS